MIVEDQNFIDGDHYRFTLWQTQLNFVVFCASSACGVSVEHTNAKKPMIRSIYRFYVFVHIRGILKILKIPPPYENSFYQYNNPYNHENLYKFAVSMEFDTIQQNREIKDIFQRDKVELGKLVNLAYPI